jgi:hypothetical protein
MQERAKDHLVLDHIQELVAEEHRLYGQAARTVLSDAERARLKTVEVELDQCWDLLRQRRGLRDAGQDPNVAQVRPADIVEKYEQ